MLTGLYRLRILLVAAMTGVVALCAGGVFDRFVWWLLVVPGVVGVAAASVVGRRWAVRLLVAIVAIVGATAVVVAATGGSWGDVTAAFGAGARRLLSTDWPSPDRSDLIGTIAFGLGLATAVAAELARHRRLHLSPLLPVVVVQILVIALSAPLGVRVRWILPLAALAVAFATLRPASGIDLGERITLLRGERRLLPVALVAFGVAGAVAVPLAMIGRADPRRDETAATTASLLDPIEATLALQAIDPPLPLHEIDISTPSAESSAPPLRWRTAALANYDGQRWSPDLVLRPIGRRLAAPAADAISATITFLDDDLQLVPLPGDPVVVDASIETDEGRTVVRLADRPTLDQRVSVQARVESRAADGDGVIGTREIDENSIALTELANGLAAQSGAVPSSDLLSRLRAIESTMHDDFTLRSDAQGGGLQRALIDRFLRDTQRGNAEQFATAYVLLVRSLGVDARVATGFEVAPDRLETVDGTTRLQLDSSDAAVWPEVLIGDQWVWFDPVPDDEASDETPPEPDPQVQTPAAPQPPIPPPPEASEDPVVTQDTADTDSASGLPIVATYALWIGGASSLLIVPVLIVVALILGTKWRRRRRHLSGSDPHRIRGAWVVATNALVDGGMVISRSDTNDQIASDASLYAATAQREVRRLASLANAATFGQPARPDLLAQDAVACLAEVETSLAEARTFWQRLRWRLSLRSLRRSTASPV